MLSGYDIEDGTLVPMYEFRHLTFQEYLTARAIVDGYYPGRKDNDTLLSVLGPHLMDGKWKEVVPLAAVLAGRNVQPLVQYLIEQCKELNKHNYDRSSNSPAVLLGQCILDEIQLAPKLLEEALEWITRRPNSPPSLILWLLKGRYGDVLLKVVQDVYISSNTDLVYLGGALGDIYLQRMGWDLKATTENDPQLCEKITKLLNNKDELQRAIGALTVSVFTFYFPQKRLSSDWKTRLKSWGDAIVPSLYSEIPHLHFAACWAYAWLGKAGAWTPEHHPQVLSRLLDLWKNSPLPDVKTTAKWAISMLPIINRELKPLPEPDANSVQFIKEIYSLTEPFGKETALVIAFYWKKPWTDEELEEKIKIIKTEGPLGWERNKSLMLEVLNSGTASPS